MIGEFLRFAQRRRPLLFSHAAARAAHYRRVFIAPSTTPAVLDRAADFASRYNIQFWDAVVCAASLEEQARVLLTEDMQDGAMVGDLRLLNPFNPENAAAVAALLE